MHEPSTPLIAATIHRLLRARGEDKSICPSEVARQLSPDDFRPLMDKVRAVAADLADAGEIVVTQKRKKVDPRTARGPIRFSLPSTA